SAVRVNAGEISERARKSAAAGHGARQSCLAQEGVASVEAIVTYRIRHLRTTARVFFCNAQSPSCTSGQHPRAKFAEEGNSVMHLNATLSVKAGILGALLAVGCGSSSEKMVAAGGADTGDTGGASGASMGGGNSAAGSGIGGKGGASSGAAGATSQSGAGGAAGANARGMIDLLQGQVSTAFNYDAEGGFSRFPSATQPANGIVCTASTIGACLVSACTISDTADPGAPTGIATLDAGTLTITGAGTAKATLLFGTVSPSSTVPGYADVSGDTQFFSGGDAIGIVGAGGVDLPAFAAQMVIAPSTVVLTAPLCAGLVCADLDRTQDLALAWTGGGAGHVKASFETIAANATGAVFCTFDAASGTGTVPKAALAVLGDTGDGQTTGIEVFAVSNETLFNVADIPTTFSVESSVYEAPLSVSN
ncbi:MAG TPA: hypothetical protein VGF76_20795, partial [Polyangiaceae bacterium]